MSPRFTSGRPNDAAVEATTRSHASTSSIPPPTAYPSTAAMSGLVRWRRTKPTSPPRGVGPPVPAPRSAPAENTVAVPVSTPHQSSRSSSSSFMAASTPAVISAFSALRFSSRWIEITRIRPIRSTSTVMGPPFWKRCGRQINNRPEGTVMVTTEQDPATETASGEFRLGKLFHLTPLVDSIADAEFFFNSVFAPLCMMRGYSSHWHRHGAIYLIAEASIEPMEPLPPLPGVEGTSWFRYMDKHGPHVHNIAFYVENAPALAARLAEAGVRTTDGGAPGTVFAHPKDTPAMLEFSEPVGEFGTALSDPRSSPYWPALRDDF